MQGRCTGHIAGKVGLTDLDLADDAMTFAEPTEVLSKALVTERRGGASQVAIFQNKDQGRCIDLTSWMNPCE